MGFFDSKSSTVNNTQTTVENKHATAGADGFAVGAGSNVSIENASDEIAADAFDANKQVSRDAFDLADDTVERLSDFGRDALATVANNTARQTSDFLSFADNFTREQNDTVEEQLDRNNKLAMHTSELIAAQAGVVAPADGKRNQYLTFGALALVALVVLGPQLLNTAKAALEARFEAVYDELLESREAKIQPVSQVLPKVRLAMIHGETGPLDDFQVIGQLRKYAGMNIRLNESGKSSGRRKISKKGRPLLRKILTQTCLPLVRKGELYGDEYHTRKAAGSPGKKAMMAVANKHLKLIFGLHRSGAAFDVGRVFSCQNEYQAKAA